jgi:demethylmenaquinone methyltransferase/2-methoxy-6-polyprenyl-1,4-benzoquinol methylase
MPTIDQRSPAPVDKSEARVRRMFGEIAPRYDLLNHLLSLGVDKYWRWYTVRRVRPQGDEPILDVCTGTGDLALAYHRRTRGRCPIVGADFCRPMLALGRRKAARRPGPRRVAFIEADAQCLPFADNLFQIVCVAFGLRNVTDTDRGLAEMVRVCRPQGQVAVLEFSTPHWQPLRGLYQAYFRCVLPRIGQALARNASSAYEYLPASVGQFPQGEALVARMRAAGLHEVSCTPLTLGIAMSSDLVLGMTGASGAAYAVRLLGVLLSGGRRVYLSISPAAQSVLREELEIEVDLNRFRVEPLLERAFSAANRDQLASLAEHAAAVRYCHYLDLLAPIASGSCLTGGMVVCPCSGGTLAAIAHAMGTNLIHRAAEVHLKERRKLILVPRETPLSLPQIDNMRRATEAGAVVLPASPGFYHHPRSIDDMVDFIVSRICDQLGVDNALIERWRSAPDAC